MHPSIYRLLGLSGCLAIVAAAACAASGSAFAQNGDGGGSEEGWKTIAKINRPVVIWHDGARRRAFNVDSDQDNSGVGLEGNFKMRGDWMLKFKGAVDGKFMHSDSVSQFDRAGISEAQVGDFNFELSHEKWGTIKFGHGDSASDGTANINLAQSNVLADAEVENWNGSFFLRTAAGGLTPLRWGDFFAGPQVGETGRFVTLWTPKFMGFEIGVGFGQPQDIFLFRTDNLPRFEDKTGGVVTDIGIKYQGFWAKAFEVKAQFGLIRDTSESKDAIEPTEDVGVAGSFAIRHKATGVNLAVNTGVLSHTDKCLEPGVVTGRCRGDDHFLYLKGGVVRDFVPWGPTAFYGEYYNGRRRLNSSDEEILRALEANLDEAEEVRRSTQHTWGLGVVQTFKPRADGHPTVDAYVGYRNYSLDVDLISGAGAVASQKIDNFSAVMAGVRLRWGESDKD